MRCSSRVISVAIQLRWLEMMNRDEFIWRRACREKLPNGSEQESVRYQGCYLIIRQSKVQLGSLEVNGSICIICYIYIGMSTLGGVSKSPLQMITGEKVLQLWESF